MTIDALDTVTVSILGKEYKLSCPPDEREDLLRAARQLDERMKAIKGGGSVIGLERIAVMAALNLSFDLLQAGARVREDAATGGRLDRLIAQADEELQAFEQLVERNRLSP